MFGDSLKFRSAKDIKIGILELLISKLKSGVSLKIYSTTWNIDDMESVLRTMQHSIFHLNEILFGAYQ